MTAKELVKQEQINLIELGDRTLLTHGFGSDLFLKHLESHLLNPKERWKWCDIACATRTVSGGRATPTTKKQMRQRVAGVFRYALNRGKFMIIDYSGPRRSIIAIKLFDSQNASDADKQYGFNQLERMQKRGEIQRHTYNRALSLINSVIDDS
jgi:hypothetical protein